MTGRVSLRTQYQSQSQPAVKGGMSRAPWVLLLVHGVLIGPCRMAGVTAVKKGKLGCSVSLPCTQDTFDTQWTWRPRFPQCAGVSKEPLMVASGGSVRLPTLPHFRGRLSLSNGSLVLKESVMSDSGVFTCSGWTGVNSITDLHVEGGCFNNLSITFTDQNDLYCKVCRQVDPPLSLSPSFSWRVNGKPAWKAAVRGKSGARVSLDPRSEVSRGKWRCTLMDNQAWHTEYCYEPAEMDYISPADIGADDDSNRGISGKRLFQALMCAGAVLALVLAAILFTCLIKWSCRRREAKAAEEELEHMTGAPAAEVPPPTSDRRPSGQRTCLPQTSCPPLKASDDLLYAQLDHFPITQGAKRSPLSKRTTIYATIV